MSKLALIALLVLLAHCKLDPAKVPKFQTDIELGLPVFKGKTSMILNQLQQNPMMLNELLSAGSQKKIQYTVEMKKISQQILPAGFPKTDVYAYGGDADDSISQKNLGTVFSWPGPAFIVQPRNTIEMTWINNLPGKHMFTIEKNLDFMHSNIDFNNFIPTVAHIHGMPSPADADGGPEGWFTFDGKHGSTYSPGNTETNNTSTFKIIVQPDEATMFYHDHSIGMTRLNFYAGLVGPFIIEDQASPLSKMFDRNHDIILSISDKSFNDDGSLYYPDTGSTKQYPNWVPEFVGDIMVVNGKAYPNMNVEKNRYRVRILNACNTRPLNVQFKAEETGLIIPFLLYKTDSNYHYKPLLRNSQLVAAGARAEIVLDFTGVTSKRVIMETIPLPTEMDKQLVVPKETVSIMSFTPAIQPTTTIPAPDASVILNSQLSMFPIASAAPEARYFTFIESRDADDNSLGVFINGIHMHTDREVFELGKEYDLYLINLTEDFHPIHTHLFNFQHYKEAPIDAERYKKDWQEANGGKPPYEKRPTIMKPDSYLTAAWKLLDDEYRVWRDVSTVNPGAVAVFRMWIKYTSGETFPFDVSKGLFVMNCRVLEHEDNDMMRYFSVQ